jgi:anti-sigma factor RsiW
MNCSQIRDSLPDYSVGILDSRSRAAVERHLEICADCRAELQAQDQVMDLVEQYGFRQPPVGLFNGVRNRIEAGDGKRARPAWWAWLYSGPARALAMGTALGALALALLAPTTPGTTVTPGGLPIHPEGNGVTTTALISSIRQHAMAAGEGPLTDRVAWEAMAQLATQEKDEKRPGVQ